MNVTEFTIITNKLKKFLVENGYNTFTKFTFRYSDNYSKAIDNIFAVKVTELKDVTDILKFLKCKNFEVLGDNYSFSKEVYLLIEVQN